MAIRFGFLFDFDTFGLLLFGMKSAVKHEKVASSGSWWKIGSRKTKSPAGSSKKVPGKTLSIAMNFSMSLTVIYPK